MLQRNLRTFSAFPPANHLRRRGGLARLQASVVGATLCIVASVLLTCDTVGSGLTRGPVPLDSVVVVPRSGAVHSGDSLQFRAWAVAPSGDSIAVPLTWFATGGTILPDGRYYAPDAPGTYTISAAYGMNITGTMTLTVRPADSLLVGVVVEPRITPSLGGGDTVRFSAYALYNDQRQFATTMTGMGTRLPVVPMYQATGGAMRPDGLFTAGSDPGTFRIVATDSSSRFSDTVLVTVSGARVATVTLDPTSSSVPAGRTTMLNATMLDKDGNVLTGRSATWSSGAPGIAQVLPGTGIVTGIAPGQAVITATSGNASGSATVTVTGPNSSFWPNEPVSFNLVTDQPWNALTALDWFVNFGTATITPDPSAPFSPPGVLTITYPIGFTPSGDAPGTMTHTVPTLRSLYVGIWWKVSNPWQGHVSNVNKVQFLFPSTNGDMTMVMYGPPGGPYELRTITQFPGIDGPWLTPNVKNVPVSLGVWHRIEWLVVYNTSSSPPNGVSRWWMDGQLIGDYQNVLFPSSGGISLVKLSPTWGGAGGPPKQELDFYWYDHTRVSGK